MKALFYLGLGFVFLLAFFQKPKSKNNFDHLIKNDLGEIVIHLEYTYGLGVQVKYAPYILFKDGSIYKDFTISPADFNIEESKIKNAKAWGSYAIKENQVIVNWPSKTQEMWKEKTWFKTKEAVKGELLNGSYKSISGVSNISMGGTETVLSLMNLSFSADKFTYESFGSATNESTTAYGTQNTSGKYVLDKNSIELQFNNGTIEKKFFYFASESKKVFGIGNTYYIQKK